MGWIFEVTDKSGRKIHLSDERWKHINHEHPEVAPYLDNIKETLIMPLKIVQYGSDENIRYYYRYLKHEQPQHILVIVKYLNGNGFIITAYFVRNVK